MRTRHKYGMRIEELIGTISSKPPLSPAKYATIAKRRDKQLKKQQAKAQREQEAAQRARQKRVWGKKRVKTAKPVQTAAAPLRKTSPNNRKTLSIRGASARTPCCVCE